MVKMAALEVRKQSDKKKCLYRNSGMTKSKDINKLLILLNDWRREGDLNPR